MIHPVSIIDFVIEEDRIKLENSCQDDSMVEEFLNDVAGIINMQVFYMKSQKAPFMVPAHIKNKWTEMRKGRRKFKCNPSIEGSIKSTIKNLEKLEIEILIHIARNTKGNELDAYYSLLKALKNPYIPKPEPRKCFARESLVKDVKRLINKYGIKHNRRGESDLKCMLGIICAASDVPYSADSILCSIFV